MNQPAPFTISYLILAHKNPAQLLRLMNRLDDTEVYFYVHVDKNAAMAPFAELLANRTNVYFIPEAERIACRWADISLVYATIALMKAALQHNRQGMTVHISGQDYPIKSKAAIRQFLFNNHTTNFMGSEKLPVARWPRGGFERFDHYNFISAKNGPRVVTLPTLWTIHRQFHRKTFLDFLKDPVMVKKYGKLFFKKRVLPDGLVPHGNSQWWALPNSTVAFLIQYLDTHPEVMQFFNFARYGDEHVFPTILSSKAHLLACPQDKPILTFVDWDRPHKGYPTVFTEEDLPMLTNAPHLFARKFDMNKSALILDLIDEAVHSPS